MLNKIILMGAHGLGKTTSLECFSKDDFIIMPEVVKSFISQNKIDCGKRQEILYRIKKIQYDLFENEKCKMVMDRCHLDILIYNSVIFSENLWSNIIDILKGMNKLNIEYQFFFLNDFNREWINNDGERQSFELIGEYNKEFRESINKHYIELFDIMFDMGFNVNVWDYSYNIKSN